VKQDASRVVSMQTAGLILLDVGRMSARGIIAHSTMDGASIAATTMISWRMGLIVAVGIIVHDITDGLNTILWPIWPQSKTGTNLKARKTTEIVPGCGEQPQRIPEQTTIMEQSMIRRGQAYETRRRVWVVGSKVLAKNAIENLFLTNNGEAEYQAESSYSGDFSRSGPATLS